ncbi:MAG: hypothetical protein RLO14_15230 [Marinobacter salarius]
MHGCDLAEVAGVKPDTPELQSIMQIGQVTNLAAETVERFTNHDIEVVGIQVCQQLLVTVPKSASPTLCLVLIDLCDGPATALGVAPADLDLIVDGRFFLIVAGVAGVDGGAHGYGLRSGSRRGRLMAACRMASTVA